ncbi:MAG: hypothetical protein ABI668_11220 [Sphingorhabdus sp.]
MPLRTHVNRMNHGKRERVEFEVKDDSREAVDAMFAEASAFRLAQKTADATKVTRTSFRNKKVPKNA